jgi:hypothetical protein
MTFRRFVVIGEAALERFTEGPPLFLCVALTLGVGVASAAKAMIASEETHEAASAAADAGRPSPRVVASNEVAKEKEPLDRLLQRQHGSTVPRRARPRRTPRVPPVAE